jgi:hypothetical protein
MITRIGITAGEIWHYLDHHGTVELDELYRSLSVPEYVILMSIGWLAREGHVILDETGDDVRRFTVYLRREP